MYSLFSILGSCGSQYYVGIELCWNLRNRTSSFIAALGAAGLAIGLALQGSLSNFAGGVLILVFKPFRVGELITVHGYTGYVESIQIFNTVISTTSHRTIILPNGSLSTSPVVNISRKGIIRLICNFKWRCPMI
jgi:small conductance mechanosensitive channel